jgi:hypothetical protein
MTAVMRAVQKPSGTRVLRAAVVRAGKVIEERVIARGAHLTVGPSERSTFVVTSPAVTSSFRLLECVGGGYRLHAGPGIGGRIALEGGTIDVDSLRAGEPLALGESARGKIVVGDTMLLFHFVEPPAAPPRAHLPIAVKQGMLDELDWKTTFIAAFSFLFHFGAVGSIYSDWTDGVVDDEASLSQVIETVRQLPPPPPVETATPEQPTDVPAKVAEVAAPKPAAAPGGKSTTAGPTGGGGGKLSNTKAAEIGRELASMDDAMVLRIGAHSNGAIGRVLSGNDVPLGMLDDIGRRPGGVRTDGAVGLNLNGSGGGVVQPGALSRGLPVGDMRADARSDNAGKAIEVKKPVGRADIAPPEVPGSDLPDAARTVNGMRAGLRACYKHGLDEDPTMQGSVRITARVGSNGEVTSASPSGGGGLSSSVIACLANRVRGSQFSPPANGGATVVIPMVFRSQ